MLLNFRRSHWVRTSVTTERTTAMALEAVQSMPCSRPSITKVDGTSAMMQTTKPVDRNVVRRCTSTRESSPPLIWRTTVTNADTTEKVTATIATVFRKSDACSSIAISCIPKFAGGTLAESEGEYL